MSTTKEKKWIERKERNYLKDVLPLKTPFSMRIETSRACNFKCIYCEHSSNVSTIKYEHLSIDDYKKFVDDFKSFPDKMKTLTFCGWGEPLLNKNFSEMVSLSKDIAHEVILITNGSLLTPKKSLEIIDAGIDAVRISLQGLNAEDYYKTCGIKIDFNKFLSNIKYFYDNKKQCKLYVKIPNICVDTDSRKDEFHKIFKNICDEMVVEAIIPILDDVDFEKIDSNYENTIYNENGLRDINVCAQPFYIMMLTADGCVQPCCAYEIDEFLNLGNIKTQSIYNMWNSEKMGKIRLNFLKYGKNSLNICKKCNLPKYSDNKYDNLDEDRENLLKKYELQK